MIDTRATHMLAAEALGRVGLDVPTGSLVGELPIAEQTLVAIARALAADAALLLLDEPTANLGAADAQMVYERLRTLRSGGTACVLITHHLDEALDVCDRITVLRDGRHVATKLACELDPVELTRLMVGDQYMRSVEVPVSSHTRARVDTVLKVAGLAVIPGRGIDLDLHAGEILGVTGLPDSGHLDLGEVVFGARRAIGGSMELVGAAFEPGSTRDAIESGVAMVPGDRLRDGLSSTMTLRENLFLSPKSDHRLISATRERRHGAEILHRFGVKPPDPDAELSTLSGGNMQKVLLAKWLIRRPRLLILCEPTVGVDVAARADIYRRLREAAEEGVAILLLSSDQDEVAELSDRAIVLRYGEVRARLEGENLTAEHLGAASQGWMGHSASKDPRKQR
jgi:ABC-type sugar transport system ATPase subunit